MSYQNCCAWVLVEQVVQRFVQRFADAKVKGLERFVHQKHVGWEGECARQRYALLLATGKVCCKTATKRRDFRKVKVLLHHFCALSFVLDDVQ